MPFPTPLTRGTTETEVKVFIPIGIRYLFAFLSAGFASTHLIACPRAHCQRLERRNLRGCLMEIRDENRHAENVFKDRGFLHTVPNGHRWAISLRLFHGA